MYYVRWTDNEKPYEVYGERETMWKVLWKLSWEMWQFPSSGLRGITFGFDSNAPA